VVLALPASRCGLKESAGIVGYLAGQSAKQCGPCTKGLPAMSGLLDSLAGGRASGRVVHELLDLSTMVSGRGACHHPDGSARLVRSTLDAFQPEVRLHLQGQCSAGGR
jgi:NADH:ubiquinone oxidoreductase subunit F (NADH-binding)